MELRFTRGEYWLLEIAVEHEWSISGLIDNELELHLNFIVPPSFSGNWRESVLLGVTTLSPLNLWI